MLNREKVITAFEQKRTQFQEYLTHLQNEQKSLEELLERFHRLNSDDIMAWLDEAGVLWPGALPTAELEQADQLCLPFEQKWQSHRDARGWALPILQNRPVLAVDGSQIAPTQDFSVPVGAVQIGWFVNEHREGGGYIKDVDFTILAPQDLTLGDDSLNNEDTISDSNYSSWRITQERFVRECEKLCELMAGYKDASDMDKPLCFFDGSFVISFVGQLDAHKAMPYERAIDQLLNCSKEYRVPLVAFVDNSASRDIVFLIDTLFGQNRSPSSSDAAMLSRYLRRELWGSRSPTFICARNDTLSRENRAHFYKNVAFTYIRLAADRAPARVELPLWIVEEGRVEEMMNLVRAECVVGTGYPYAIETADALAVIRYQDRQRFYAMLQQFTERENLPFTQSRKARSKQARR